MPQYKWAYKKKLDYKNEERDYEFFAYTVVPCTHCGMEEKRHRELRDFRRQLDEVARDGFTTSLAKCPGFQQRTDERRKKVDVYLDDELRQLFRPPVPEPILTFIGTRSSSAQSR